jgi:hypothetical protein
MPESPLVRAALRQEIPRQAYRNGGDDDPPLGYGVNVPAMSFQLHEWDIHALCFGRGDARVTRVRFLVGAATWGEARLERLGRLGMLGMLVSE